MGKFGINENVIESWKDDSIFLEGQKDIAVILLHGWSAFPRQMSNLGEILNKKGYWVYIPLLKGHGSRPEDLENAKADEWIKDTENAIDEVGKNPKIKNIFIGGNSMGGSLAIIGSIKRKVAGVVLLGTPVHVKHHFFIWLTAKIISPFNPYLKKSYPKNVKDDYPGSTSYQYFPVKSVLQCLAVIKKAAFSLGKVDAPVLILQTNFDYMVTKYSPWIIYNMVKSKVKKLQWVQSKYDNHTMTDEEVEDAAVMINNFIADITGKDKEV